jgi:hypothetical protein
VFAGPQYTRSCLSFGKGEENKTPGFIVCDTVVKARKYLESIGKGKKIRESFWDEASVSESDSEASFDPDSSMLDAEELDPMSDESVVEHPDDDVSTGEGSDAQVDESFGEFDVSLEDLQRVMEAYDEEVEELAPLPLHDLRGVASAPLVGSQDAEFQKSDDSYDPGRGHARSSTKIRAATLGYLWGFHGDAERLRAETLRLTSNPDLCVLHLCGCGLPYINNQGVRVPGCCEWSHLKLGTLDENTTHKFYHITMGKAAIADYPALCDIIHRADNGTGLF